MYTYAGLAIAVAYRDEEEEEEEEATASSKWAQMIRSQDALGSIFPTAKAQVKQGTHFCSATLDNGKYPVSVTLVIQNNPINR